MTEKKIAKGSNSDSIENLVESQKEEVVITSKNEKLIDDSSISDKKSKIKIQQIASSAGHNKSQIATLKGLSLNKIGKIAELEDTVFVRGMVNKVKHLLRVF